MGAKVKSKNTSRKLTIDSTQCSLKILAEKAANSIIEDDSGCCKQKLLLVVFASNNIVRPEKLGLVTEKDHSFIHFYIRISMNKF